MSEGQRKLECPHCSAQLLRPAREGGMVLRNRFLRVMGTGEIVAGCPRCGEEVPVPSIRPGLRVAAPS